MIIENIRRTHIPDYIETEAKGKIDLRDGIKFDQLEKTVQSGLEHLHICRNGQDDGRSHEVSDMFYLNHETKPGSPEPKSTYIRGGLLSIAAHVCGYDSPEELKKTDWTGNQSIRPINYDLLLPLIEQIKQVPNVYFHATKSELTSEENNVYQAMLDGGVHFLRSTVGVTNAWQ